jgi:hypothetical protein
LYERRRDFLKNGGLFLGTTAAWSGGLLALSGRGVADPPPAPEPATLPPKQRAIWDQVKKSKYVVGGRNRLVLRRRIVSA